MKDLEKRVEQLEEQVAELYKLCGDLINRQTSAGNEAELIKAAILDTAVKVRDHEKTRRRPEEWGDEAAGDGCESDPGGHS